MMTIHLHGALRRFGRQFRLDVKTPAEAIRALSVLCPGFRQHLRKHSEPGYHVVLGKRDLAADDLALPSSESTLRLVPVVAGANNPWVRVVIGAILIYATSGAYGWQGFAAGGAYAGAGTILSGIGMGLALGGIAQIVSGTPKAPNMGQQEDANNRPSFAFDGAVNTVGQGHPVPVLYGRMIVGSAVISAGLSAEPI